jgi:hypothetical protein
MKESLLAHEQLDLFNNVAFKAAGRQEQLVMSADALLQWKVRVFNYQQQVRNSQSQKQTSLFDLTPTHCDPDSIAVEA